MTYANLARMSNGAIALGSSGSARLRADADAPNGINLGESITLATSGEGRNVIITLPEADYSAYPEVVIFWRANGLVSHWPFVPTSGTTTLGPEIDVLGRCAGTFPKYELCPADSAGLMGFASSVKQVTGILSPSIESVIIEGSGYAGSVHTATVEYFGSGTIALTYQWRSSGVAISGATAATYTPPAAVAALSVTVIGTSEYDPPGVATSDPIEILAAIPAVPGLVVFTADTGGSSGEIDIDVTALPSAGDGATIGGGTATLDRLEYSLDGGAPITLTESPAVDTFTITTTPGAVVLVGVRAVSDYPRTGEWSYYSATANGSTSEVAPVYTGGLFDLEILNNTAFTRTWSDYFTGANSYVVNTGLAGGVSSGTGNVTYTVAMPAVQTVIFSITAINTAAPSGNDRTTRTFNVNVVAPATAPFIKTALPDVFVVNVGATLDYDATQHFGGTGLTYTATGLVAPVSITTAGRIRNTSALSSLIGATTFTVTATNSLGAVTSASVPFGVVIDPATPLTATQAGLGHSEYRYANWRTPIFAMPALEPITLGANPISFAGANTAATITDATAAAVLQVGQQFAIIGATTVQGVDVNSTPTTDPDTGAVTYTGKITVTNISGSDISFTAASAASGAGSGGGSAVVLSPLYSGVRWSRRDPDGNGQIASEYVEESVLFFADGTMQLIMQTSSYNANPDTQSPRRNYSVWGGEATSAVRLSHTIIPGQEWSGWSGAFTVPLVLAPDVSAEWLPTSTRPKGTYDAGLAGNQGQQYQRCRTWNIGIIDPDKRGWLITHQDENGLRLAKNGHEGTNGSPVLWGFPRADGYFGGKSGGLYLNTDDNAGAGLALVNGAQYEAQGFILGFDATGVYRGDGTLNWFKKITITRPSGPGPFASGTSGPKLAFAAGGSPNGTPEYFGNSFDRRGNFIARRPQVHENQGINVFKTTKALLDADLAYAAGTKAVVYADATASNRAIYTKSGASGSGSWTKGTVFLTDAQRPIYVVEQHGSRGKTFTYLALFKSTDGGVSFSFVRELDVATYASSNAGIYFVHVAPNGYVMLLGTKGAFQSKDEGVTFTRIYTNEVSAGHYYGGTSTTPSGIRLGDTRTNSSAGVYTVTDSSAGTLSFSKPNGNVGLPSGYNIWDMECAASNQNRILVCSNTSNPYLSTDGGRNWASVPWSPLTGENSDKAFRYNFNGGVATGHSGFLFCPTNDLRVVGFTSQSVSQSIDGGASFQADRAAFFDGMHNRGYGWGPMTGSDPWKKVVVVSQDSLASVGLDGVHYLDRSNFSTGNSAFMTALANAGAGSSPAVSGASAIVLANNRVVCGANRNTAGQSNVMCILYERQSDGSYPNCLVREDLGGKKSRVTHSAWSLADPSGYAFLGRWGVGNTTAAPASITFDDHSGHEFFGQRMDGSTALSYWNDTTSGSAQGNNIYISDHPKGLNGQGTAWKTVASSFYCRAICADPHRSERVLYVRGGSTSDRSKIYEVVREGGVLVDRALQDTNGVDVDFKTLVAADFTLRIPGGATLPTSQFACVAQLVSDPYMAGLFYAVVSIQGVPNVWMTLDDGHTWSNIAENLPRSIWFATVNPYTGDLFLDSSMGRHILPPPVGYPTPTYKGALSTQAKAFYDQAGVPNPPNF